MLYISQDIYNKLKFGKQELLFFFFVLLLRSQKKEKFLSIFHF